jgi:adenosylcobinamide kinase/adenosylcobinamide-phosphate guanylyltransferase
MPAPLPKLTFVLGGARSGKSRFAEELLTALDPPWTYIAAAEGRDAEMRHRIDAHRARRGEGWTTVEAPLALADAILDHGSRNGPILVDCLTLWLSNIMLAGRAISPETDALLAALAGASAPIVAVSNEVGLGIVPETPLGREFRDAQGRLNAEVAALANRVVLVVAGLPLDIKKP